MSKANDKLRVWGSDVDEGTRRAGAAGHAAAVRARTCRLMADAHIGIGGTVGSVIPTKAPSSRR